MLPLSSPIPLWAWGGQRLCQLSFTFVKFISDCAAFYLKILESIVLEGWAGNYMETLFSGDPGFRCFTVHVGSDR